MIVCERDNAVVNKVIHCHMIDPDNREVEHIDLCEDCLYDADNPGYVRCDCLD